MKKKSAIFSIPKPLIGMIHLPALPGTPASRLSVNQIVDKALEEAEIYCEEGIHALMLENMHDLPYLRRQVGPEIVAAMTAAARELKRFSNLPCGVQILAGANKQALAVAQAADLDFVRVEGFVFSQISDEGMMHSDAGELLRYRRQIGAEHIAIWADIKKKHSSHAITADVGIAEMAKAAEFFRADGLIITGTSTGLSANVEELKAVREAAGLPLLVGSGITAENIKTYLPLADGFIVGSYFKEGGCWDAPLSRERVRELVELVELVESGKSG